MDALYDLSISCERLDLAVEEVREEFTGDLADSVHIDNVDALF